MQHIQERRLQNFYPPNSPVLDQLANRAASQVGQLCSQWRISQEIGNDIVQLGLYDIILYIGACILVVSSKGQSCCRDISRSD